MIFECAEGCAEEQSQEEPDGPGEDAVHWCDILIIGRIEHAEQADAGEASVEQQDRGNGDPADDESCVTFYKEADGSVEDQDGAQQKERSQSDQSHGGAKDAEEEQDTAKDGLG